METNHVRNYFYCRFGVEFFFFFVRCHLLCIFISSWKLVIREQQTVIAASCKGYAIW